MGGRISEGLSRKRYLRIRADDLPKCAWKGLFKGTAVEFEQNRMWFDIYSKRNILIMHWPLTTTTPPPVFHDEAQGRALCSPYYSWTEIVTRMGLMKSGGGFVSCYHTISLLLESADGFCTCSCCFCWATPSKRKTCGFGGVTALLLQMERKNNQKLLFVLSNQSLI